MPTTNDDAMDDPYDGYQDVQRNAGSRYGNGISLNDLAQAYPDMGGDDEVNGAFKDIHNHGQEDEHNDGEIDDDDSADDEDDNNHEACEFIA